MLPDTPSVYPLQLYDLTKGLLVGHSDFLPSWFSCSRVQGFSIKLNTLLTLLPFPFTEECDDKQPLTSKEEEERRIAEMGRPILGEHTKLEVIIEESYEFKVCSPTPPTGEARAILGPRLFIVLACPVRSVGKERHM